MSMKNVNIRGTAHGLTSTASIRTIWNKEEHRSYLHLIWWTVNSSNHTVSTGMKKNWKGYWREQSLPNFKSYPRIGLEGLIKLINTNNLNYIQTHSKLQHIKLLEYKWNYIMCIQHKYIKALLLDLNINVTMNLNIYSQSETTVDFYSQTIMY